MLRVRVLHYVVVFFVTFTCVVSSWAAPDNQGTVVTATYIIRDTVVVTEEAMGRIETKVNPKVAAEVSGVIQEVFVDIGQAVEVGTPLVTIDPAQLKLEKQALQAEVDRFKILIANQQRTVERYRNLLIKKSLSRQRFDDVEVKLSTLQKQLQSALSRLADNRIRLSKTFVLAPISGLIEKRFVSAGDFVEEGSPLVRLVIDQSLRIILPFPENVAANLAIGQQVTLSSPLTANRIIQAKINQFKPAVNIQSRAVEVIIYLENHMGWRPGGTVNGIVIIDRHQNSMLVPSKAVVRRPAGNVVFEIKNDIASQRQVTTGRRQGELVEIIKGLSGDERIVVDGAGFLTDGAVVLEKQR